MAKLTNNQRKAIPAKDFALPSTRSEGGGKGGYPIPNKSHAQNALARVAQFGTPEQKTTVKAKVAAKFPGMGKPKKSM